MILALDYLKTTNQTDPALEARFREKIEVGYQRLLGFEVPGEPGGFDWWGKPPANLFLSAYGLMSFLDMAEVHPIDPQLPGRIVAWLRSKQAEDGSWRPTGVREAWSTDMAKGQAFNLTAYVAWGLARAGEPDERATRWIEARADEARDPYGLAIAALALLEADAESAVARRLVDRLVSFQARDADGVHWMAEVETGVGGRGRSAAIETTALAVMALLEDGRHGALAQRAVERLALWRDPDGRFGTTQSTILALKALLAAARDGEPWEEVAASVEAGGEAPVERTLSSRSTEPETIDLGPTAPAALALDGEATIRATVARTTWRPWDQLPAAQGRVALETHWPQDRLEVGRQATAQVVVRNVADEPASVVTLEIGLPPGCTVEPEDVDGEAERIERGETRLVIYLRSLAPGETRGFRIAFTPRYALDVRTAPSKAYEYYVPEEAALVPPSRIQAGTLSR